MPELVEEYGPEKMLNFYINIPNEDEETKEILDRGNKVTFKKDTIELLSYFSFSMNVEQGETLELVRKGLITFKGKI